MRQRYKKIYEDYKPAFMFYKEILLCRKLLFAVIVTMNRSVEMQCVRHVRPRCLVLHGIRLMDLDNVPLPWSVPPPPSGVLRLGCESCA